MSSKPGQGGGGPGPGTPQKRAFNKAKLLQMLLSKGAAADIAKQFNGAVAEAVLATLGVHGVTAEEYRRAGGRAA